MFFVKFLFPAAPAAHAAPAAPAAFATLVTLETPAAAFPASQFSLETVVVVDISVAASLRATTGSGAVSSKRSGAPECLPAFTLILRLSKAEEEEDEESEDEEEM